MQDQQSKSPVRIINAAGYLTRLGNSIMDPPVLRAMEEASRSFIELDKAQLAASSPVHHRSVAASPTPVRPPAVTNTRAKWASGNVP